MYWIFILWFMFEIMITTTDLFGFKFHQLTSLWEIILQVGLLALLKYDYPFHDQVFNFTDLNLPIPDDVAINETVSVLSWTLPSDNIAQLLITHFIVSCEPECEVMRNLTKSKRKDWSPHRYLTRNPPEIYFWLKKLEFVFSATDEIYCIVCDYYVIRCVSR